MAAAPSPRRWRAAIARLSSGTKMLFIMSGALLPLGLIAFSASLHYSHSKRVQHIADARLLATSQARQLDVMIYRAANVLRFTSGAEIGGGPRCRSLVADAGRLLPTDTRIALFGADGSLRCASPSFTPTGAMAPSRAISTELTLLPTGLRFAVRSESGAFGVGELPATVLRAVAGHPDPAQGLTVVQGDRRLDLAAARPGRSLDHLVTVAVPFGNGQLSLSTMSLINAVSAIEVLLVLVPLMMWAAAALIGWAVINELLLRPLGRLQRSVANAAEADAISGHFIMPQLQTPAREIRALAEAFATATEKIAQREIRLEEGLRHQVLLTREVHHRVKNNLQVVASLINLHARGTGGDVAAAYASIQRRVDALAIVHRNHYAELEKHEGVSLRSLVAELTANLRAGAPAAASHFTITLNMMAANVSQDVAVPVAFLITELVEILMMTAPGQPVQISLLSAEDPGRAMLMITSPGLTGLDEEDPEIDRFRRIVTGLARQLRGTLSFDGAEGEYRIAVPILADPPQEIASS